MMITVYSPKLMMIAEIRDLGTENWSKLTGYYRWARRGGDAGEGVRKNQKPTKKALYVWKLSQETSVGRSESGGEPLARLTAFTSTFRNL